MKKILQKTVLSSLVIGSFMTTGVQAAAKDDPVLWKVMVDELEYRDADGDNPVTWDAQAWLGQDVNKLWIKTEGERADGETEDSELQALYSKAVSPYWDVQVGFRHDFEPRPTRGWLVVGLQGLAPYFFEVDAALFIGESGRTGLRLKAEYELLLTQKLILTPELEINFHGRNDPATGTGSGLSDIEFGLRLRYEIRRGLGPYIGVNWEKQSGNTAAFSREDGEDTSDTQLVFGIRATF